MTTSKTDIIGAPLDKPGTQPSQEKLSLWSFMDKNTYAKPGAGRSHGRGRHLQADAPPTGSKKSPRATATAPTTKSKGSPLAPLATLAQAGQKSPTTGGAWAGPKVTVGPSWTPADWPAATVGQRTPEASPAPVDIFAQRRLQAEAEAKRNAAIIDQNIAKMAEFRQLQAKRDEAARQHEIRSQQQALEQARRRQEAMVAAAKQRQRYLAYCRSYIEKKVLELKWLRINAKKHGDGSYRPKVLAVVPAAYFDHILDTMRQEAKDKAHKRSMAEQAYDSCCLTWTGSEAEGLGIVVRRLCGIWATKGKAKNEYHMRDYSDRKLEIHQLETITTLDFDYMDHAPVDIGAPVDSFAAARRQHALGCKPGAKPGDKPDHRDFEDWAVLLRRWETEAGMALGEEDARAEAQAAAQAQAATPAPAVPAALNINQLAG